MLGEARGLNVDPSEAITNRQFLIFIESLESFLRKKEPSIKWKVMPYLYKNRINEITCLISFSKSMTVMSRNNSIFPNS